MYVVWRYGNVEELGSSTLPHFHTHCSNARKLPRGATVSVQPPVLFRVGETPGLRVPSEGCLVPVSQVAELGDGDRSSAGLHVCDRVFAAAYAVEPVPVVTR